MVSAPSSAPRFGASPLSVLMRVGKPVGNAVRTTADSLTGGAPTGYSTSQVVVWASTALVATGILRWLDDLGAKAVTKPLEKAVVNKHTKKLGSGLVKKIKGGFRKTGEWFYDTRFAAKAKAKRLWRRVVTSKTPEEKAIAR